MPHALELPPPSRSYELQQEPSVFGPGALAIPELPGKSEVESARDDDWQIIKLDPPVDLLTRGARAFPALQHLTRTAVACGDAELNVSLTADPRDSQGDRGESGHGLGVKRGVIEVVQVHTADRTRSM